VRIFDVLSFLSTVVGLQPLFGTAQTWIRRVVSSRNLSLAILSFFFLPTLQGGLAVGESKLMADGRQSAELSMTLSHVGS